MLKPELLNNLALKSPDTIFENEPLKKYCSLGVGGEAEIFAEPDNLDDLKKIFVYAVKNSRVHILGGGSNLIFADGLIKGVILSTRRLNNITWLNDRVAEIEAGYKLAQLLKILPEKNLGGLEFAIGIPGTIGGALAGNAGTVDHGVCDLVSEIKTIESNGGIKIWRAGEFKYAYRKNFLIDENYQRLIISCTFEFRPARSEDPDDIKKFMARRKNQPLGVKTAGSTFKNPANDSAGRLLDIAGCKNFSEGGACISDKHANFIVNFNNASAKDVINLINKCRERVFDFSGINLEPEIKIIS